MAKKFLDGYKTYDTSDGFGNPNEWKKAFSERMSKEKAEEILNAQPQSPYCILGISNTPTKAEIKSAFRKLIKEWHPDVNRHRLKEAEEMSKRIIAAYSILS